MHQGKLGIKYQKKSEERVEDAELKIEKKTIKRHNTLN